MKFTNYTSGPKGVHTANGLVYVEAGQTSADLDVSDAEAKAAKATGWFSKAAAEAADPLDHDADGKKGGAAAPKTDAKA